MEPKKTIPIVAETESSSCSGAESYTLMVLGDSMLPEFEEGEIIVIEPDGLAHDGSFVIAMHKGEHIFRQLVIRDGRWFLKALNGLFPVLAIPGPEAVKGVIIQKSRPGARRLKKFYV